MAEPMADIIHASKRSKGRIVQRSTLVQPIQHQICESRLAGMLMEGCGFGYISAAQVQLYSSCAMSDGCDDPVLKRMAGCGNDGKYPSNIKRELDTLMNN